MGRGPGTAYSLSAFVICSVLLCAVSASATTVRQLSLKQLVAASDKVVAGVCTGTRTKWLDKKVYTIASFRVSAVAKGSAGPGETLEVYLLGGRVRKPIPVAMHVPGGVTITKGEEAVLFLEARGEKGQYHRVVGLRQGKIPIGIDSKTGEKKADFWRPVKEAPFVDPAAPASKEGKSAPPPGSLTGLLGRVQTIDREQREAAAARAGAEQ